MTGGPDGERRDGLIYGASAYLLWGLFPAVLAAALPAGTIEILAQRMAWSLRWSSPCCCGSRGGLSAVRQILSTSRTRGLLLGAAVVVTVNWGTYIYGVNTKHVVETSLGYFINPLFTILLGVLVLGERLRPMQWLAVAIGGLAVVVIAVDYGHPPWIALTLAVSFGLYGFFKKRASVGAADSMAVETGAMFVPAIIALAVIGAQGNLVFGSHGAGNAALLAGTGVVTVIPLLLFAAGTRRSPLSTLGLLQYLAPVLQFAVGVGIRHEFHPPRPNSPGSPWLWLALIILTVDGLRSQRVAVLQDAAERSDRSVGPPPGDT